MYIGVTNYPDFLKTQATIEITAPIVGQMTFYGLHYDPANIEVYRNGVRLIQSQYNAPDGISLTLYGSPTVLGEHIEVVSREENAVGSTVSSVNGKTGTVVLHHTDMPDVAWIDNTGKIPLSLLPPLLGGLVYVGIWDASLGTPPSATPVANQYWLVSVAGNTNLSGITTWAVHDMAVWNGVDWEQIGGSTQNVISVNGQTGIVNITTVDKANTVSQNGTGDGMLFNWNLLSGQPSSIFGSNDGLIFNTYNPSNFHVNRADFVDWNGVDNHPTKLSQFENDQGFISTNNTTTTTIIDSIKALSLVEKLPDQPNGETYYFTGVIALGGFAKTWGKGDRGELASGENSNQNTPRLCSYWWGEQPTSKIVQFVMGGYNSFVRTENKEAYAAGENANGQLGVGSSTLNGYTTLATEDRFMFKRINHIAINGFCENITTTGVHGNALSNVTTFFTLTNGSVYATGWNANSNAGVGVASADIITPQPCQGLTGVSITKVVPTYQSTYMLGTNGKVYACGSNEYGQLARNIANSTKYSTFVECLKTGNIPITNVTNIIAHTRRYDTTRTTAAYCIDSSNILWGVGDNAFGNLGLGNGITTDKSVFTQVTGLTNVKLFDIGGRQFSCIAVTHDNEIYTWGDNDSGVLGHNDNTSRQIPTKVTMDYYGNTAPWETDGIVKIIANKNSSRCNFYVLTNSGKIYATGRNDNGELGQSSPGSVLRTTIGSTTRDEFRRFINIFNVALLPDEKVIDLVTLGDGTGIHILALTNRSRAFATGYNSNAQTGISTNNTTVFGFSEIRLC